MNLEGIGVVWKVDRHSIEFGTPLPFQQPSIQHPVLIFLFVVVAHFLLLPLPLAVRLDMVFCPSILVLTGRKPCFFIRLFLLFGLGLLLGRVDRLGETVLTTLFYFLVVLTTLFYFLVALTILFYFLVALTTLFYFISYPSTLLLCFQSVDLLCFELF